MHDCVDRSVWCRSRTATATLTSGCHLMSSTLAELNTLTGDSITSQRVLFAFRCTFTVGCFELLDVSSVHSLHCCVTWFECACVCFSSSRIWNGMIHPLLEMPIFGAIWHQGMHSLVVEVQSPTHIITWLISLRDHEDSSRPVFTLVTVSLQLSRHDSFTSCTQHWVSPRNNNCLKISFNASEASLRSCLLSILQQSRQSL